MSHWTVLIPDRLSPPADIEQEVLGGDTQIMTPCTPRADEVDDTIWRRADAVIAWHEIQLSSAVIQKLDRCRAIIRCGAGFDNVDVRAAGRRGIPVCNVPYYGTNDVADHALALMLTIARGVQAFNDSARASNGNWNWEAAGPLRRLTGSVLGIIGLGRIGTATAMRGKAFGMRVVFYDPYLADGWEKSLGVERAQSLPDLLSQADVLSLHTPLTDETRFIADDKFFAQMKPSAILINTARGPLVKLDALEHALRTGRLRAAGLDVLETEPPDDAHPLICAWRLREPWLAYRLVIQ